MSADQQNENPSPADLNRKLIADARRQVEQIAERQATQSLSAREDHGTANRDTAMTSDLPPPGWISGYKIIRRIHGGGQGVVYQAVQIATQRKVAVKVLNEGPFASPNSRERFKREIGLVAGLDHPHIVKVLDSGIAEGRYFYAMDYIRGGTLSEFVSKSQLSIQNILTLFAKICDAVQYAHRKGVIHRDLKPSNILVDHRGEPHLVDFGMAKVAGGSTVGKNKPMLVSITGQVVGTLPYMSPEQAMGDPERVDARTDIYALGVILYQLLTGHFPYEVIGNMRDVLENIIRAEPRPPSSIIRKIDNEVETIILKALSKEPERRYQSAEGLGRDLSHYLAGEPIEAKRASRWYVMKKSAQRHRRGIMSTLLITVVVIIAGGYALHSHRETEKSRTMLVSQQKRSMKLQLELDKKQNGYLALSRIPAQVSEPPPKDLTRIDSDATAFLNVPNKPNSLNPLTERSLADVIVCELLYERLFWRTTELELKSNEHLIAMLENNSDPLVKVVHLRPGLTWHDGQPLTAEDVVFSWHQTVSRSARTSSKYRKANLLRDVHLIDPTTIRFTFKKQISNWRLSMNFEIVPCHLWKDLPAVDSEDRSSQYDKQLNQTPIGSGPFQFYARNGKSIILKRWRSYSVRIPYVDRLVIRWINDPTMRLKAFLDGRLDLVPLTDNQYHEDVGDPQFIQRGVSALAPGGPIHYIMWNCRSGSPFADRRLRQAMAHVLNIPEIIAKVMDNHATLCNGPFSPFNASFNPEVATLEFNPQHAAELLEQAGWHLGTDGRRMKEDADGRKVPFVFDLMIDSESARAAQIASIFKEDLAKIGADARIFRADWENQFLPNRNAGRFDAYIGAMIPAIKPSLLASSFESGRRQNYGGYENPQVDQLFQRAERITDLEQRVAIFQHLHQLIYDDQPMAFLYYAPSIWAVSKRLGGVQFSIRGPFLFHPGILDWWVRKANNAGNRL